MGQNKIKYIRTSLFPNDKLEKDVMSAIKGQSGIVKVDKINNDNSKSQPKDKIVEE